MIGSCVKAGSSQETLCMLQEADIRPFRGMLLGLFFVTTGASLDVQLLLQDWPIVLALLGGLLAVKVGIIGSVSRFFGLSRCALLRRSEFGQNVACSFRITGTPVDC